VTTVKFGLPHACRVKLEIYNIAGQRVRTLVDGDRSAGYHAVSWQGTNDAGNRVASGVYLYRITAGDFVQSLKMLLLK